MGLGFSKIFVGICFLAAAYAYWLRSVKGFFVIMIPVVIIRIIWRVLTK